jgi:8-oxo-dGTP diphosphatase
MLKVSCALIIDQNKILVVQRNTGSDHPLKWEFPGGKLNQGESPEECVIREIREELEIKIEILKPLISVYYDYGIKQIELIPFLCRINQGEIILNEHHDFKWVSPGSLEKVDFAEADRKLIQVRINQVELKKHLRKNMNDTR